jgi:hypothetical protein
MSTAAFAWMGATWTADTSYPPLRRAARDARWRVRHDGGPTTERRRRRRPADQRGAAASIVMVVRLLGPQRRVVGADRLGPRPLRRPAFDDRPPPITDPGFDEAHRTQESLTAQAIAETFTAAAVVIGAGVIAALAMRRESFGTSTITVDISVDEDVPVSTEIVIDREITVPIETTIPITETFDTTIEVDTPLGFSVPLDVSVPVDIEVPVDLDVVIPINETVPIDQTFPLQLDVPVTIDVSGTELADLAASLADGLRSFRDALGDLEQPD